ncbi:ATP-binding protein [Zhouia sp. PK063]|uniref:ATP-binding protein n=1 Tax=Zhouia sp. PK063 TaxID=3373602 RepID=UPI00379DE670
MSTALYPRKVDLTNCDKEPIHILGKTQKHGVLLVCELSDYRILQASENTFTFFGLSTDTILDANLADVLNKKAFKFIKKAVKGKMPFQALIGKINEQPYLLIPHVSNNLLLIDVEPATAEWTSFELQQKLGNIMTVLGTEPDVKKMCQAASIHLKDLLGYDRVMIYKFDEEWNGEVIAESREEDLESWLGLHYPASDIPSQARQLFLQQGVRIISDVYAVDQKIIPELTPHTNTPLDIGKTQLRAASPIHIEYLQNMKVGASLTAAIVHNGNLWGLIACHHYSPKFIGYHIRQSCKFLTEVFSNQLTLKSTNASLAIINESNAVRQKLIEQMSEEWDIVKGLTAFDDVTAMNLNNATGVVIKHDGEMVSLGKTPNNSELLALFDFLSDEMDDHTVFRTESLSKIYPEAGKYKEIASGIMYVTISKDKKEYLIWFKPEEIQTVDWGGNPDKAVNFDEEKQRLNPRKSFEKWSEKVRGRSMPWEDFEVSAAISLQQSMVNIIINKYSEVKELNQKLEQANDDLSSFSYSVSHDLRGPLRGIDGFAQILLEDYFDALDDYGQSALKTIVSSASRMNELIDDILAFSGLGKIEKIYNHFSPITLIKEILKEQEVGNNIIVNLDEHMPDIYGDRSMIKQLYTNLITNAIKYSGGKISPEINIGCSVQGSKNVYFVEDNGIGFDMQYAEQVFGVFTRLVGEEYPGSGVGLAIAKRVVQRHNGEIWVKSNPNMGTTFYFYIQSENSLIK